MVFLMSTVQYFFVELSVETETSSSVARNSSRRYPRDEVRRKLSELVRSGAFDGDGILPSEQKLADRLGVSRTPVRTALKSLEAEGVLKQASTRGYVVAARAPGGAAGPMGNTIVFISDVSANRQSDMNTPGNISGGIGDMVQRSRRNLFTLHDVKDLSGSDDVTWFLRNRPLGVVPAWYLCKFQKNVPAFRSLVQAGIPLAMPGDDPHLQEFDRVASDQEAGGYALMKRLLELGCRRIQPITWRPPHGELPYWMNDRLRGCERALDEAGLTMMPFLTGDASPIKVDMNDVCSDELVTWTRGLIAPLVLGDAPPVDAVLVPSDAFAEVVGRAVESLQPGVKHPPKVAGFDNYWLDMERIRPEIERYRPVATVDILPRMIGRELVAVLEKRIAGELPAGPYRGLVTPQLVKLDEL